MISFLPRFVYSLGSPSHDYFFLFPFYANYGLRPPIVREGPALRGIHQIIARLVQCYLASDELLRGWLQGAFSRIALLYRPPISRRGVDSIRDGFPNGASGKTRARFGVCGSELCGAHHAQGGSLSSQDERAAIRQALKRVAGMSFVSYLLHVRLSRSVRLLKETSLTIAEIACEVGFSDQSYFDRRFKKAFGHTPRDFRRNFGSPRVNGKDRRSFAESYNVQDLGIRRAIPSHGI